MSKSIHRQLEVQNRVIANAGYDPDQLINASNTWWKNPLNTSSLRLTPEGFRWFTEVAKLTSHQIDVPKDQPIVGRHMLQLENLFEDPYFIRGLHTIFIFGERDAIMLKLHSGNLTQYLDNLQNQ